MTPTQPFQRSWFFRQSWLVQFALVFFGAIVLLSVVVIFWGMSSSFSSDGGESGSSSDPAALATISNRSTLPIAASSTAEATASPTEDPTSKRVVTATDPAPTTDIAALEEIYARAAASLQQPGKVYHGVVTLTSEGDLDPYGEEGTIEHWVDANQNVSRTEIDTTFTEAPEPAGFDLTRIIGEGTEYEVNRKADQRTDVSPSDTCYGANEAVSVVLGCPGGEETTTTIEEGEFGGQPAVILVTPTEEGRSSSGWTFTSRHYLDADTFLPIAVITEGTSHNEELATIRRQEVYEHEFIPRDSLPADFFSTVALAEEQIEAVEVNHPIYWLGSTFEPGGDLPRLALKSADQPNPQPHDPDPRIDLFLSYRLEEFQFMESGASQSQVNIQVWPAEEWHAEWNAAVRNNWEVQDCQIQHVVEISDGQATIFMGTGGINVPPGPAYGIATAPPIPEVECGNAEYTRYEAIVDLGETVLFIWLPEGSSYRSQAGLEAIVRGLEPRS